ncbi:MAG: molybdate ABC transporter permease subunit, partial [Ruminobacter sp.]|nr:molybdate ABC transporter permease subunit [Ruminobacter sp.]
MDLYPLYNSVRIALISTVIIFFAGTAAAYYISRLPRAVKGFLDVILTIPLVLPPTVIGYLLLRGLGPHRIFGEFFMNAFDIRLTMTW